MSEQTTKTIKLDQPIKRGEQEIAEITLRKPTAGELRGVPLLQLMQIDVAALATVLPRITNPTLTVQDVNAMDSADLMQAGLEVCSFLIPKAQLEASQPV